MMETGANFFKSTTISAQMVREKLHTKRAVGGLPLLLSFAWLLVWLLPSLLAPTIAQAAEKSEHQNYVWSKSNSEENTKNYRSGFYIGWGWAQVIFDPDLDNRSAFTQRGIDLDGTSDGSFLLCGIGFGPYFTSEMRFMYFEPASSTTDITTRALYFAWDSITPLTASTRFQPYVSAGFAGLGVVLDDDGDQDIVDIAMVGNFGGGLLVKVGTHACLSVDYRYAVLNFQRELTDLAEDEAVSNLVGGGGSMQYWTVNLSYDF